MSRPRAREVAMKLVYSRLLGGTDTPDAVLEKSGITEPFEQDDYDYAESIVQGISDNLPELDKLIAKHSLEWSINRIARVDLAILRVSVYELLHRTDVPKSASINEAVELAKTFGGEKSYSFVNGILGAIARELPQ